MEKDKKQIKPALGRGLSALISHAPVSLRFAGNAAMVPEAVSSDSSQPVLMSGDGPKLINISQVEPNSKQPRTAFNQVELDELVESIKSFGILQPVLVRPLANGRYQIVAGERRYRAAKAANIAQLPVIIKDFSERECLEAALIENVQRSNLNPIEEAKGYSRLCEEFGISQDEVATRVGKSRPAVTNLIRLLKLGDETLALVESGKLSIGHAKAILAIKDGATQERLAKKAIEDGLSVRDLEELVAKAEVLDGKMQAALVSITPRNHTSATHFPELADRLRGRLGTKVAIKHKKSGRGKIEVEYFSQDELNRLVDTIITEQNI